MNLGTRQELDLNFDPQPQFRPKIASTPGPNSDPVAKQQTKQESESEVDSKPESETPELQLKAVLEVKFKDKELHPKMEQRTEVSEPESKKTIDMLLRLSDRLSDGSPSGKEEQFHVLPAESNRQDQQLRDRTNMTLPAPKSHNTTEAQFLLRPEQENAESKEPNILEIYNDNPLRYEIHSRPQSTWRAPLPSIEIGWAKISTNLTSITRLTNLPTIPKPCNSALIGFTTATAVWVGCFVVYLLTIKPPISSLAKKNPCAPGFVYAQTRKLSTQTTYFEGVMAFPEHAGVQEDGSPCPVFEDLDFESEIRSIAE